MQNKLKQLDTLIKILDQKYNSLTIDYDIALEKFNVSNNCIYSLRDEIEKNNRVFFDLMSSPTECIIEKHTVLQNYIKSLFSSLHNEIEDNEEFKNKVDSLDSKRISVRTESKGYEMLVNRYKAEISLTLRDLHNKEMDEMWLLKRDCI